MCDNKNMNGSTLVSVTTLLQNDPVSLVETFLQEMDAALSKHYEFYEIVLVDNGSSQMHWLAVKESLQASPHVRLIALSKQYDEELACTAALDHCIGDYVVLMDLRTDPPTLVPEMVERAMDGYEVVIAKSTEPPRESALVRVVSGWLDRFSMLMTGYNLSDDWSKYVCFSRRMVNAILQVKNRTRFLKLLKLEIGYKPYLMWFEPLPRDGRPRREPTLLRRLSFTLEMIVSHSDRLLRFVSCTGFLAAFLNFLYIFYVIAIHFLNIDIQKGWTTLSLVLASMFGLLFLILAVLGEYIAHIFVETRKAPLYYVMDEMDHSVVSRQVGRKNVVEIAQAEAN